MAILILSQKKLSDFGQRHILMGEQPLLLDESMFLSGERLQKTLNFGSIF
jgi:hypothetical protein